MSIFLLITASVFLILVDHYESKGIQEAYHDSLQETLDSQREVNLLAKNNCFISMHGYPEFNDKQSKMLADWIKKH